MRIFKIVAVVVTLSIVLWSAPGKSISPNIELVWAVASVGKPAPYYDQDEHWELKTSFRMWQKGGGSQVPLHIVTAYINNSVPDTTRHTQRVELVSPDGRRVLDVKENNFEMQTLTDKFVLVQRAYIDAKITVPALNTARKDNFGVYIIKIYLDGDLVKKYPYPILAR